MGSVKYCDISCSWSSQGSKTIYDAVLFLSEDRSDDNLPPLNSFGVTLEPNKPDRKTNEDSENSDLDSKDIYAVPCMLSLSCHNPPYNIRVAAVDILSESRTVEVYGAHEEYLQTCHGLPVEINDGNKLYLCQHSFSESVNKCNLKLLSPVKKEEIWLQSLHVTVSAASAPSNLSSLVTPTIDMNRVKDLMADMGARIPDGAKNLMDTVETMQKNRASTVGAMEGMLNTMMGLSTPVSMSGLQGKPSNHGNSDVAAPSALANLMTMFAKMKPNSPDEECETHKGELSESEKQTVCIAGPSEPVDTSQEYQSLTKNEVNALSGIPPQSSVSRDKTTGATPDQADTYQIIYQHIASVEQRLKYHISQKVAESEQRIQSKLDRVLSIILQGQSNRTFDSSKVMGDLTPD